MLPNGNMAVLPKMTDRNCLTGADHASRRGATDRSIAVRPS